MFGPCYRRGSWKTSRKRWKKTGTNSLGLSEVRWRGAGKIPSDGSTLMYSGGESSERGVGILVDPKRRLVRAY